MLKKSIRLQSRSKRVVRRKKRVGGTPPEKNEVRELELELKKVKEEIEMLKNWKQQTLDEKEKKNNKRINASISILELKISNLIKKAEKKLEDLQHIHKYKKKYEKIPPTVVTTINPVHREFFWHDAS